MTDLSENALTAIEFVILARLSQPANSEPPKESDLASALVLLEVSADGDAARQALDSTLTGLRQRDFVTAVPKKPRQRHERWSMTDRGARALRDTLGFSKTPLWVALRDNYLPALQLGLTTNVEPGQAKPGNAEAMNVAVLAARLGVAPSGSSSTLCDALILEELKMPANTKTPITLVNIRAWVLAQRLQRAGIEFRDNIKTADDLDKAITKAAARALDLKTAGRSAMLGKLRSQALHKITKLRSQPTARAFPVDPPPPANDQTLLVAINEAIPRIGSDGRHGPEKVFVSAIWQTLERDRRTGDMSIDNFKRWLLDANRRRVLDLARADHVSAMNGRLVADSEIRDFGATFHFVLDRHADSDRGNHARKA